MNTYTDGLNTLELDEALRGRKDICSIFQNVLASDQFTHMRRLEKPLVVVNTEPSNMDGEHWIAVYVDEKNCLIEVFDSVGLTLEHYGIQCAEFISSFDVNYVLTRRVQPKNTMLCGHYCLYYALEKSNYVSGDIIGENIPSADWVKSCIPYLFDLTHIISDCQCCKNI